ncbi:MAG: hypothetical protein KA184_07335 [Candidatus Hydrogenedentes bacterium]|nr:hypothetical protein [Candidatus Hydrogenedentota bacterium]
MKTIPLMGLVALCLASLMTAAAQDQAAAPAPAPEAAPAPAPEAAPAAPAPAPAPERKQVSVSVKIIEYQTTTGVDTGLSAFFKQRNEVRPYLRVSSGNGNITSADLTFPANTFSGITVFLDRLTTSYGDIEAVLQALVDQNRASILAQPKVMVMVGQEVPTKIETTQDIPFEDTRVVGATAVQVTTFRPTGVMLSVKALGVIDDDGNPNTTNDTFINLEIMASVKEEGQRITVALDDQLAGANNPFSGNTNAISVPEFVSREISTRVWVQHGQVLVLGGLYRNTRNKNLTTLPWLIQGEDLLNATVARLSPIALPQVPLSTGLGSQDSTEGRRELVFLLKAEEWRPSYTVGGEFGFMEEEIEAESQRGSPRDVITGIVEGITELPQNLGEQITGPIPKDDITSSLGGGTE